MAQQDLAPLREVIWRAIRAGMDEGGEERFVSVISLPPMRPRDSSVGQATNLKTGADGQPDSPQSRGAVGPARDRGHPHRIVLLGRRSGSPSVTSCLGPTIGPLMT